MVEPGDDDRVQPGSLGEWREWLAAHHGRGRGVWLVTWRAGSAGPKISYEESVEQALCFGWVDSKGRALDAERTMLWFAPRKARSGWSRPNKQRVERLLAAGLMAPAGLAAVESAKADGSWTLLDAVEDLLVPGTGRRSRGRCGAGSWSGSCRPAGRRPGPAASPRPRRRRPATSAQTSGAPRRRDALAARSVPRRRRDHAAGPAGVASARQGR